MSPPQNALAIAASFTLKGLKAVAACMATDSVLSSASVVLVPADARLDVFLEQYRPCVGH
eukprot:scaffold9550_cov35-Tisochrysis_lutea.AAC.3